VVERHCGFLAVWRGDFDHVRRGEAAGAVGH
jgi:hypothetical protein